MSKSLALLSGKGGSGKTSLALSIASLLGKCKLRVLLVDCDLSTNGATYFFEDRINDGSDRLISFFSFFLDQETNTISFDDNDSIRDSLSNNYIADLINDKFSYVNVNENIDFLPSIIKLSSRRSVSYNFNPKNKSTMSFLDKKWRELYDVIIYDCEAGYSDILKTILPFVDLNLVVMEADAISSAALRSLYLKIGNLFNGKKIYQVFNKATKEEYDVYSKVSGGTVFTNIETVMFDWTIRKAFSTTQVPDLETTSAHYGQQVYNICNILFREDKIQHALRHFEEIIQLNELKEKESKMRAQIKLFELEKIKEDMKSDRYNFLLTMPVILLILCVSMFFLISYSYYSFELSPSILILLLGTIVSIIMEIMSLVLISVKKKRRLLDENKYKLALDNLVLERESMENQIKQRKKSEDNDGTNLK